MSLLSYEWALGSANLYSLSREWCVCVRHIISHSFCEKCVQIVTVFGIMSTPFTIPNESDIFKAFVLINALHTHTHTCVRRHTDTHPPSKPSSGQGLLRTVHMWPICPSEWRSHSTGCRATKVTSSHNARCSMILNVPKCCWCLDACPCVLRCHAFRTAGSAFNLSRLWDD